MKALANPVFLRAAVVFFCSAFAFVLGLICIRALRKNIDEDFETSDATPPSLETLPMHVYNTVIQQLKQQKHELQVQNQAEQRRAKTSENFSQAVLSNLSSGLLVFGTNGLIKQTNPAAKEILGFASPTGMSAQDIFRGAMVNGATPYALADEVHAVLREASTRRQVEADYTTPGGEQRHIAVTVSPLPNQEGSLLGVACLISDLSHLEQIRRQQELQGEISAEMALELRTSLTTISGYAQQLAGTRDSELAKQLAADIANEAARLDRSIGGRLAGSKSAAAKAGS